MTVSTQAAWPRDNDKALDAFYTRPDGSARWEVKNLVYIFTPWISHVAGSMIELKHGIRVHKKVAADLGEIFSEIWNYYGKSQKAIEAIDLDQIGGAYHFRTRPGGRLSNHAYGVAIDIDPLDNPMRRGSTGDIPKPVSDIFQNHGWRWGRNYGDPMHFEAVFNNYPFTVTKKIILQPSKLVSSSVYLPAINKATIALVMEQESFRAKAYQDGGRKAIGYGRNEGFRGFVITPGMVVTKEQAYVWLRSDLYYLASKILLMLGTTQATDNQLGALSSFSYNLGLQPLSASTLLRKFLEGDVQGAADEFLKWNKAKNAEGVRVVRDGLTKRRVLERKLFISVAGN